MLRGALLLLLPHSLCGEGATERILLRRDRHLDDNLLGDRHAALLGGILGGDLRGACAQLRNDCRSAGRELRERRLLGLRQRRCGCFRRLRLFRGVLPCHDLRSDGLRICLRGICTLFRFRLCLCLRDDLRDQCIGVDVGAARAAADQRLCIGAVVLFFGRCLCGSCLLRLLHCLCSTLLLTLCLRVHLRDDLCDDRIGIGLRERDPRLCGFAGRFRALCLPERRLLLSRNIQPAEHAAVRADCLRCGRLFCGCTPGGFGVCAREHSLCCLCRLLLFGACLCSSLSADGACLRDRLSPLSAGGLTFRCLCPGLFPGQCDIYIFFIVAQHAGIQHSRASPFSLFLLSHISCRIRTENTGRDCLSHRPAGCCSSQRMRDCRPSARSRIHTHPLRSFCAGR